MFKHLVVAETTTSTTLGTLLFVSLCFLLLLALIKKFAWGSIAEMLEKRAAKIANDLDSAEQSRIHAASLEQERQENLVNSRQEAATIVNNAKSVAEKSGATILNDAKDEARQVKQKAKDDIELERQQALSSVKDEVAEFSVQIATKILQKELTKEAHEDLINSCIEGLGNNHETR
ncbi:F0F1 ATP synthase subunit B [Vagococcus entomophilus]|uniref:ATP synthase subunit b n=1 Tax=Vagococcus entomophilus TaxID=1160095 RepID=A0A430AIY4_9ENTE|nr:F0F1 ATP synthase subunit B [Vagococcus entomophilus]RSU07944.1 ATP synthase F0 subunit B [Vagococcus entomophilus]